MTIGLDYYYHFTAIILDNLCYAHDICTRNRYQILVPDNWYQNCTRIWHQFVVPVARFLVPETNMADDADEIAQSVHLSSSLLRIT